jgi:predicted acylesterase/phospholipase RssA
MGIVVLATALSGAGGCTTTDLVNKFNSGILDSSGDPNHKPADRSRALVKELVTHELMDAYFTQGTPDGLVAQWLDYAATEPHLFAYAVLAHARSLGSTLGVVAPPVGSATYQRTDVPGRERFGGLGAAVRDRGGAATAPTPICNDGKIAAAAGDVSDAIRFDAAIERAGDAVTAIAIEGLANLAQVEAGAKDAFQELSRYMKNRRWQRRFDRHVNGVVIKGGASTGLYSAGVVWVALNLARDCKQDAACRAAAPNPSFTLISGTSTGAMIAVATDLFNTALLGADSTDVAVEGALDNLASWFTCVGVGNLYCVRSADATAMLVEQTGLVEFDGIQSLLTSNVACSTLTNPSELVLNTVDFRTGTLYDLSDQDELRSPNDVVQGAIASAVLPFIAKPVPHLPVDYDPAHVEQTYLDGGIRAELPILPLARRGAERVLVVSSSASITDETHGLNNGLTIATRYIDVSTGGVTESEIQHAERHVESVRLAEIDTCMASKPVREACADNDGCMRAFCEADWPAVCDPQHKRSVQVQAPSAYDLTDARLASLWSTRSFFRNETEVAGLHGYDFDPVQQRRLFLAGAEAARLRCSQIATLLGIPVDVVGPKLVDWCSPVLKPKDSLCKNLSTPSSTSLRQCGSPPPAASMESCR